MRAQERELCRYSNWTLSPGNTGALGGGNSRVHAATSSRLGGGYSRALDDGRSIAFTEAASEWQLSPRGTVRDDLDVGHSESALP